MIELRGPSLFLDDVQTTMFVDANAMIDYLRESVMHILGMAPTDHWAVDLRLSLNQKHRVLMAKTAYRETERNLSKDLAHKLGEQKADEAMDTALPILRGYRRRVRHDNTKYVALAQKMYARINADSTNQKLVKWKNRKGKHVANPVLGSDINDLKILSTAVHHAKHRRMMFLTHDMDFIIFADEIYRTFGLRVIDTHNLGM